MQQFPTAAQLSSWAGLCPANHESAGVKKSVRTNRGNVWLKTTLTQRLLVAAVILYALGAFRRLWISIQSSDI
jgi:transposase